ncbi:hypothetical protein HCBG_05065 [Histoplasma capsulatum G186AR]|uniref:Uncharacterized protein n=1 Tax=Ajellomyces capsulatus (strain G186AR / H82 / ATCC MYA-2454 / RMSCC 2432) TaxID=447093 RepID=C0NPI5_AJECG|nr:uncharacterized protein HCBG_05065 [Histoplasma capsulatum G186AR]EEH06845.1 hypothetical protein HCBG_05065 [Histoplasma capsulatum G186AR]
MCQKEEPNTYTWKCGHTTAEFTGVRIHFCGSARTRGSRCANPTPTSKGSSRGYSTRAVCPDCRKKKPDPKPGNDDSTGAGGSTSTSTLSAQPSGVTVGA